MNPDHADAPNAQKCILLAAVATLLGCGAQDGSPTGKQGIDSPVGASGANSTGTGGSSGLAGASGTAGVVSTPGADPVTPVADPVTPVADPVTPVAIDPSCGLDNAAFCDAFAEPSPGGRGGDLDDAKWSFARLGFGCAPGNFAFVKSPINLCGAWQTVEPGGPDSQFCQTEDGDPRWAEGFDDNSSFNYFSVRMRQPFDFAGRTGTIQWEADARTSGSHGWWLETWITDSPVPGPALHDNQIVTSKEAVGVVLSDTGGLAGDAGGPGTAGTGKVGVSEVIVVHDYQPERIAFSNEGYVNTVQGELNKVQFKLSTTRIEVWASDVGSDALRRIASADINLVFSRGYVQPTHVHYNASKSGSGGVTNFQSYQWARVAFDGPQLPTPRAYQIPDSLKPISTCTGADGFTIGYKVSNGIVSDGASGLDVPHELTFVGVDPSGGVSANLDFNTMFVAAGDTISYRLNGKQWHDFTSSLTTTWERQGFSVPVPVSDLVAGDNTVEFATNSTPFSMPANSMVIANIDLEIQAP